jgi:hypothetical protein
MPYTNETYTTLYLYDIINNIKSLDSTLDHDIGGNKSTILFNGKKVIPTHIDYINGPKCLENLCVYEYAMYIGKGFLGVGSDNI